MWTRETKSTIIDMLKQVKLDRVEIMDAEGGVWDASISEAINALANEPLRYIMYQVAVDHDRDKYDIVFKVLVSTY
jgi:hypothetical protein